MLIKDEMKEKTNEERSKTRKLKGGGLVRIRGNKELRNE
jgi:hypothetical protein